VYRILGGKPERKRPLRKLRHRWEDNIRMNFIEQGGKVWSEHLAQNRNQWQVSLLSFVNMVKKLWVP